MKHHRSSPRHQAVLFTTLMLAGLTGGGHASLPREPGRSTGRTPQVLAAYGKLPLSFEANQGQTDPSVKFLARGSGYTLFLTPTEAVLTLSKPAAPSTRRASLDASPTDTAQSARPRPTVLRMKLVGANPSPRIVGDGRLPGASNYFRGNDPKQWHTKIPNYARVQYGKVWPGVDLVYYGNQRRLEYDFVVAPGADPGVIRLAFAGAQRMRVDEGGDLVLRTAGGELRQQRPVIYQEVEGRKRPVSGRYVIDGQQRVGFRVAKYDRGRPLVIDPVITYGTYLGGGSDFEFGEGITVDGMGQAYVTGATGSSDFPTTTGAFAITSGGAQDAFVTKLNAGGTSLLYSTYLGGSSGDGGTGIAVDGMGEAHVTGNTRSGDFPTTTGAFDTSFGGVSDAFVTKLNATGSALLYSTYLGGNSSGDTGRGIVVDGIGQAYVTGDTSSSDFPTTVGAFDTTLGGSLDGFVTKLNAGGTSLLYSTFLGGSSNESGRRGIAVDGMGEAYVTGNTRSSDFPTTVGAFDTTYGGDADAFVTKLNAMGSALVYSTYLGGSGPDHVCGIAVDGLGQAYVTGFTDSSDFPTTPGAFATTYGGGFDSFVAKIADIPTTGDLTITKTASPDPVKRKKQITYTIIVTNNGPHTATSVVVMDTLPPQTTFVSCSATGGGVQGGTGNVRTVTFASLAPGASATITLVAEVQKSVPKGTVISNTATVSSGAVDPNSSDNSAMATVTVHRSEDDDDDDD